MTKSLLIAAGLQWLRYERACSLVMIERGPRFWAHRPDLVGITRDRYCVEVEIKMTVSDYKADERKERTKPRELWYLMPPDIARECVTWQAGLLTLATPRPISGIPGLRILRPATVDVNSPCLHELDVEDVMCHTSGSLVTAFGKLAKLEAEITSETFGR